MNTKKHTLETVNIVKELAAKEIPDCTIAKHLNVSYNTVRYIRGRYKIPSGGTLAKKTKEKNIIKLHAEGHTWAEISRILNISDSDVSWIGKKLNLNPNWTRRSYITHNDHIKGYMIRRVKHGSKRRNLEFNLDYTDIDLPKTCPLLNVTLNYTGNFQDPFYPTVDRLDNNKGYIKGNVWVISRLANTMKNCATLDQLSTFSKNIQVLINNQGALGGITDLFPNIELKT